LKQFARHRHESATRCRKVFDDVDAGPTASITASS
jgi:hypothetical protein